MARKLNRALPGSDFCVITGRENEYCCCRNIVLYCRSETEELALVLLMSEDDSGRRTQPQISHIPRPVLWRKRIWRVSVHPWHVLPLIWCASVCSMEGIQLPLTRSSIPESVFPPLTSSPIQPPKIFWPRRMERIISGVDVFLRFENFSWNQRRRVSRWRRYFKSKAAQKRSPGPALEGVDQGNGGADFWSKGRMLGSGGDTGILSPHLPPPLA